MYTATVKQQNFIAVNLLHFVKNKILLCLSSSRRQSISLVKHVLLPPGKVSLMFRQTTPNFCLFAFYYYLKQQLEEFERKIFPVAAEESPSFESRNEF